ncbi:MAG: hypothetical protein AB7G44_10130 [Bacteroidia bacterium]
MKKTLLILSAFIAVLFSANAQSTLPQVVLCSDYDKTTGAPIDIYTSWDVKADGGGYVYVVYTQDKKIKDELSLRVEKKNYSGLYETYGTFYFGNDVKAGQTWAMYDMHFTEEGDYRLNVLGKSGAVLASTNTTIYFLPEETDIADVSDGDYVDTYYYENSFVTFGESVDDGGIVNGESSTFNLENGTRKITAKLEQDEALLLTKLYVTVYLGEEIIAEDVYDIPSTDWNYITVPITVTKPGSYYVDFYSQDDEYINTGYFDVVE